MALGDPIRNRVDLWLRGERAFGLRSVRRQHSALQPDAGATPAPAARPAPLAAEDPAARRPLPTVPPPRGEASQLFVAGEAAFAGPARTPEEKARLLKELDAAQVSVCRKCRLHETRTNTVFGEGDPDAQLMFIGEGPGETEDLKGRPFVGRAGELLDKMIGGMGLKREQVFIANVVKCRPPNNRAPMADETEACTPYLVRQIEIIRPTVIVTLGLPASRFFLQSALSMGELRGRWYTWRGIKVMPTFHPAYLLRSYTPENRGKVWSDLRQVMAELGLRRPGA